MVKCETFEKKELRKSNTNQKNIGNSNPDNANLSKRELYFII